MSDFYEEMWEVAQELLAPTSDGGLGQGSIALVRYIPGPPAANSWDPPSDPVRSSTPLDGVARGVSKEFVGMDVAPGNPIVATDLQVIVAPWGGQYGPGDVLEIDTKPHTILRVDNIPAAGIVSAVRFIVRG